MEHGITNTTVHRAVQSGESLGSLAVLFKVVQVMSAVVADILCIPYLVDNIFMALQSLTFMCLFVLVQWNWQAKLSALLAEVE